MTNSLIHTPCFAQVPTQQSTKLEDYPTIGLIIKVMGKIFKNYSLSQNEPIPSEGNIQKNESLMKAVRLLSEKISMHDIILNVKKDYPEHDEAHIKKTFRDILVTLFQDKIKDALPKVIEWMKSMNLTFDDVARNIKNPDNTPIKPQRNKPHRASNARTLKYINMIVNIGNESRPFPFDVIIILDEKDEIVNIVLKVLGVFLEIKPVLNDLLYALNDGYHAKKQNFPDCNISFLLYVQGLKSEEILDLFKLYKERVQEKEKIMEQRRHNPGLRN